MSKIKSQLELITALDVYDIIGKKLQLSPTVIKAVFNEYFVLYKWTIANKYRLTLPSIGQFYFNFVDRKKAGSKYGTWRIERDEDGKCLRDDAGKMIRKRRTEIRTEAKPSYCSSKFAVHNKLQQAIKQQTMEVFGDKAVVE